ncbi:MAG: DUF2971 domain-containing protein [Desulfovermiculus sp.]|nr:DUF2971 domain-containing protein [Desulfovermiculus sp.]
MNDPGEFEYARNLIFETLNQIGNRQDLPPVVYSLTTYAYKNLDKFLNDSAEMSSAYCACLTVASDQPKQWETYAENGKGFALGINLLNLLNNQRHAVGSGKPFVFCAPVTYNEADQRDLVLRLVGAGLRDIQAFSDKCSQRPEDLTKIRNRVTQEIVVQLFSLIDFMKAPSFSSEQEFRLILDTNDGTLRARNVQHYKSGEEIIFFVFIDLIDPNTKRLPLAEIKVGPTASFEEENPFLEKLLDELGYGCTYSDRPAIIQSLAAIRRGL